MSDILNRTILLLASACMLLALASCDLIGSDEPLPFAWVQDGAELVYDFHPVSDTLVMDFVNPSIRFDDQEDALTLTVRSDERFDDLIFDYSTVWGAWPGTLKPDICELRSRRGPKGIYDQRPSNCATSIDDGRVPFLRIPSGPRAGDEHVVHICSDPESLHYTYSVEAVNQQVTTPAGTFTTFVLAVRVASSPSVLLDREYWSEQDGLIRIETFDEGELLGYYELASKSF